MGTGVLHDKYSPVTCSRCAVIGNMICACRENCESNMLVVLLSCVSAALSTGTDAGSGKE